MQHIDNNWIDLARHILDFNYTVPNELKAKVAADIRAKYLGDRPISRENQKDFVQVSLKRKYYSLTN